MQTTDVEIRDRQETSSPVTVYRDLKPNVEVGEVLRLLGARNGSVSTRTVRRIKTMIKESGDILEPQVLVSRQKVLPSEQGSLRLAPGVEFKSRKLSRTFRHCSTAKVFVATVGEKAEKKIKSLIKENRSAEASILDAIASVAVEDTIETVHRKIDRRLHDSDKCATLRFSPGYCDWNIKEQEKLFDVLDASRVGVSLSENSLMSPRKSISGIFGVGACGEVAGRVNNPCMMCSKTDCNARRT